MSEDVFLKALEKNQKRKEDEESARQGGTYEYGENFFDIKKMNIQTGKESVFRIAGKPYELREESTDVKLVYHSRILNDKGRYSHIFWPTILDDNGLPVIDKDWVLYKLFEKVTEGSWKELSTEEQSARTDDRKYEKVYNHVNTKSFEWVDGNKAANQPYPPKFKPKPRILMNVIDRHDDWCKKNKKMKVPFVGIGYGKSDTGEDIEFLNDVGFPKTAYDAIMESVVAFTKHWDLDIVLKRNKDVNNAYVIRDISENKISDFAKQIGTDIPLTEEEKAYEKWDLDTLFKPTSYSKLLRVLGGKIKLVDAELGTDFYSLIKTKAEEEKKEYKEAHNKQEEKEKQEDKKEDIFQSVEEKNEEPVVSVKEIPKEEQKRERVRSTEEPKIKPDPMEFIKNLPNFSKLDKEDVEDIKANIVDIKDNIPVWEDIGLEIPVCDNKDCKWPGTEVQTRWPNSILHCAVCGIEYKQA